MAGVYRGQGAAAHEGGAAAGGRGEGQRLPAQEGQVESGQDMPWHAMVLPHLAIVPGDNHEPAGAGGLAVLHPRGAGHSAGQAAPASLTPPELAPTSHNQTPQPQSSKYCKTKQPHSSSHFKQPKPKCSSGFEGCPPSFCQTPEPFYSIYYGSQESLAI